MVDLGFGGIRQCSMKLAPFARSTSARSARSSARWLLRRLALIGDLSGHSLGCSRLRERDGFGHHAHRSQVLLCRLCGSSLGCDTRTNVNCCVTSTVWFRCNWRSRLSFCGFGLSNALDRICRSNCHVYLLHRGQDVLVEIRSNAQMVGVGPITVID